MRNHHLPDELLSEILTPALKVSDAAFADVGTHSPFAIYAESSSAYLLVSKSWLRVATPLLYHVVVIRSKAQAAALGRTLTQNPDLGRFIKKLRVEGGYGQPIYNILSRTPNVADLYLNLDLYAYDSTVGFCKGLPLINPARLIVNDQNERAPSSKLVVKLFEVLAQAIRENWDNLVTFECNYDYHGNEWAPRAVIFFDALAAAKRLRKLLVESEYGIDSAYDHLEGCPLQIIEIRSAYSQPVVKRAAVNAILRYELQDGYAHNIANNVPGPADALVNNPTGARAKYPLEGVPQLVQELIWSRVSIFLFHNAPHKHKLPFLGVSRTFYKAALANCYADCTLTHSEALIVNELLNNHPEIVSKFHRLNFRKMDGEPPTWFDICVSLLSKIGPCLRKLSLTTTYSFIPDTVPLQSPTLLLDLVNLRVLECGFRIRFSRHETWRIFENALPKLEHLTLYGADESLVSALSYAKLPALLYVRLFESRFNGAPHCEPFLQAHGSKLLELEVALGIVADTEHVPLQSRLSRGLLDYCPHALHIRFFDAIQPPPPQVFDCVSSAVEKISLQWNHSLNADDILRLKSQTNPWATFFATTPRSLGSLPRLREIHLEGLDWPTNERGIAQNFWVGAAEGLLKRCVNAGRPEIKTTDGSDIAWRPRLKVGRAKS
ncbi:F-box domain-containing protein [Mycena indigotica]|uniref:F-box domain-containing protein n=1 Tax=Mycena indigotica TaxID=2126181 RepID=A0A8H6T8I2_9AGAR|nr:F-box domain-containing protein [Mycena indigotica]KAF7311907.1 F-box domain-containing protein [Mycena indigotica]